MAIADGNTISASDLNTSEGGKRTIIDGAPALLQADHQMDMEVFSLTDTTAEALRTRDFVMADDAELRVFGVFKRGGGTPTTLTATLTAVGDDDGEYLLGKTVSEVLAYAGTGSERQRTAYTDTTGDRIWLKKGVRYRMQVASTNSVATDYVAVSLIVRTRMRSA